MSKRSIPFIVGGVLVLGVCGVLAWEAISPTGPGAVVSASASAEGNPTAAEIAALKPALDEVPPAPDPEKLELSLPEAPASVHATEVPPPSRPPQPVTVRQSLGVPRQALGQRPQTGAPVQSPKPSSSKPGTITDFGGRRF